MKINEKELFALLTLWSVPNVGPKRIRQLVAHFGSVSAVCNAKKKALTEVEGIDEKIAECIVSQLNPKFAEDQLQRAERAQARIVTYWDEKYPEILKNISDPPVILFVKGPLFHSRLAGVALVGTRFPSSYGRIMAEKLASFLSHRQIPVVSGLARGIDTICHTSALQGSGSTVGILGSGIDVIYPPENHRLYREIAEKGVLVSEFPMGTTPEAPHFPRRNRIISGLSYGTVVIEAGETSGALITAEMALEQNREVFAVPGNATNPKSLGANRLIQQGAKLVLDGEDILAELPFHFGKEGQNAPIFDPSILSEIEKKVWESLSFDPLHIDDIAQGTGLAISEILTVLLNLELKECVQQLPGKRFMRRI